MADRLTASCALQALAGSGSEFIEIFRHGSLVVEIYQPTKVDLQQPHSRDELYVVIAGSGFFVNGGVRHPFSAAEVLFVPAGVEHRFEEFTDDFATWVFFFGPEGGEAVADQPVSR